jgi:hypothetical protein
MPRIRTFDLPLGLPGGELSVRADPADFGLAGESIAEAAGALTDLGQVVSARQAGAARAQRLNEAVFGAVRDLSDLQAGLADDAEPETLAERFANEAAAIAAQYRGSLGGDPPLERTFASLIEPLVARGTMAARTSAAMAQAARFRATLESGLSELAARTAAAPDGVTRDFLGRQAAPLIRAGLDAGLIGDGEAAGYARRFQMRVDQAQALRLLESDPASALSRLADPRDFPALDAQTRAELRARAAARAMALPADEVAARAQAGLSADIAAEQARVQAAVRLSERTESGAAGFADIEDAAATGEINAADHGALIAALCARRARDERDAEHIARVGAALRGDAPPLNQDDESDRAAADVYYASVLAPALASEPSDATEAGQIVEFAARTGIVPSAVVARARAEMSFGTAAERARAARLVAALPEHLRDQMGADFATYAGLLAPLLDAGLPRELALRVADSAMRGIVVPDPTATLATNRGTTARGAEATLSDNAAPAGSAIRIVQPDTIVPEQTESIDSVIQRMKDSETLPQRIKDLAGRGRTEADREKAKAEAEAFLKNPRRSATLQMAESRIWAIRNRFPTIFDIKDDPAQTGAALLLRNHDDGVKAVQDYDAIIAKEAKAQGVDPDLVRAIMYFENAGGRQYGEIGQTLGISRTILPININPGLWEGLGGVKKDEFTDPAKNVRAGVALIKEIESRLRPEDRTPAKIGSIWNFAGKFRVSSEGARIQKIFDNRAWEKRKSDDNPR